MKAPTLAKWKGLWTCMRGFSLRAGPPTQVGLEGYVSL